MKAIQLNSIGKCYSLKNGTTKWAIRNVSTSILKGESVGILGANGAGKSTLLKILAGITLPTEGEADIHGSFSSLLEVGTGFHPDLSGKENIFLNGSILGLSKKQIYTQLNAIIEFSGVSDYIDEPLRTYSSGMKLRLAFAVMAHLTTDVIALDEVLAVGDSEFQIQCIERIFSLKNSGKTILFVSHNLSAVKQLCDRVIVLDKGQIVFDGKSDEAISFYTKNSRTPSFEGSKNGYLKAIQVRTDEKKVEIFLSIINLPKDNPIDLGVNIADGQGNALFHISNRFVAISLLPKNGIVNCLLHFEHCLKPGNYPINVFIGQNNEQLEWTEFASSIEITPYNPYGFHNPEAIQASIICPFEITQL